MNKERILHFIQQPYELNHQSLEEIQQLLRMFPYAQNLHLLYLLNLEKLSDIRFEDQLKKTAARMADRAYLKKQIDNLNQKVGPELEVIETNTVVSSENTIEYVEFKDESNVEPYTEEINEDVQHEDVDSAQDKRREAHHLEAIDSNTRQERNRIRSKAELLQKVKDRLAEIEKEKSKKSAEKDTSQTEEKVSNLQKNRDLIDQFIRVEPHISRPENVPFFDPDTAARESLFQEGAFVTETLAKIYFDQGNYQKAKEIYQVLSLNNPEKSSYFAALIQELENKLK
jgi:cell division protein FtsB